MAARGVVAIASLHSICRRNLHGPACTSLSLKQSRPVFSRRHPRFHTGGRCYAQASKNAAVKMPETDNQVAQSEDLVKDTWTVKMLFDGCCPLCMREVNMLRERNSIYETIKFVDISAPDYSPKENEGIDFATAMGRIHAILPDGTILYDVKAFKKLYEAVGLGWVYAFTKFEPLAKIADAIYSVWAKYRLPITGRPPLVRILEERQKKGNDECKRDNSQIK